MTCFFTFKWSGFIHNETPTVRGLAAEKNNKLYMETMIFLWNNHYNLKFNVTV